MIPAQILFENQLLLLNKNIPRGILLNVMIGSLFALLMLNQAESYAVMSWLGLLYLTSLLRYLLHAYYVPPAAGKTITPDTHYLYLSGSLVAGLVWGSTLVFFTPKSIGDVTPIALALAGIMAGGISVLSYFVQCYLAFMLPIALPMLVGFILIEDPIAQYLGYMFTVYIAACLYFSRVFNRVLTETLVLHHENKALANDLRRQKERAEQANLDKSRFLAAASHDLRQPLHALSLLFEALKETEAPKVRQALYPKIASSLEALNGLFTSLLDISKLDAGVVEAKIEDFRLDQLIEEITNLFESEALNKNLKLRWRCKPVVVSSDRLYIGRILRNLISNALRYTESGSILVSCRNRNEQVLMQVWDTGLGIDPKEVDQIFNEFYQLHNPERDRRQGLGLGLSIVKRLAELLRHDLNLRSRLGHGTVVSLLIDKGQSSLPAQHDHQAPDVSSIAGLRVLVIDDDVDVLTATRILLEKWGCLVHTASDSAAVLNQPDLTAGADFIISDLRLPGKWNGIELLNKIQEKSEKTIPSLLITGDTKPERIQLVQNSAYMLLHKPLKPARLRSAIQQKLSERAS